MSARKKPRSIFLGIVTGEAYSAVFEDVHYWVLEFGF